MLIKGAPGDEVRIFWGNKFDITSADALAPDDARSSTVMVLTMQDIDDFV